MNAEKPPTEIWDWSFYRASTPHPGIMNGALADGSARGFAVNISPAVWLNLLKPDDGNVVGEY